MLGKMMYAAALLLLLDLPARAQIPDLPVLLIAAPQGGHAADGQNNQEKKQSPSEKMQARFPQPVNVGYLIGLPVLDGNDSTIGYVTDIVQTAEGKIQLIVPYGRWFGWVRPGGVFDWGRRPVPVPIEAVAILAKQINALDMERDEFDRAPVWIATQSKPMPRDQTIQIAIGRR